MTELDEVLNRIERLETELQEEREQHQQLENELEDVKENKQVLEQRIDLLTEDIDQSNQSIAELQSRELEKNAHLRWENVEPAIDGEVSSSLEGDVDGISDEIAAEVVFELVDPARVDLVGEDTSPEEAIPKLEAALTQLRRARSR